MPLLPLTNLKQRTISLIITVFLCLLVCSTAHSDNKQQVSVGIFEFQPVCFLDDNKQPAGIYVDILNKIASQENWQIHYVFNTWNKNLTDLRDGKLDILVSIAQTPEREIVLDFSKEAVLTLWGEVYVLPNAKIENILDLQGKHVAIMKGDVTGDNFKKTALAFEIDCTFIEVPTLHDILHSVENNTVDAGIIPSLFGITHHNEHKVKKTPIMFSPLSIYFAGPKGKSLEILTTLDQYLRNWKKENNSYYDECLEFWLSTEQYSNKQVPRWLTLTVMSLLVLAILFAIWVKVLHKQVSAKTQALKKSNERYQTIFDSMGDAIVIHDATTGKILDINETMLSMVGCDKEDALDSINILSQGPPPFSATEAQQYIQKADQGQNQLFEWKLWRKDGSSFWCEVALKANTIFDQKVIIAVARDIEERKQHEEQLRHAHRMEAIGSLAGGIAHDFNNILTGIFGYTELAKLNQTNPEKLDAYLGEIQISAERAKNLITQIQTFSKKHPIKKQPLQLSAVTEEVLKLLSSSIPATIHVIADLQSTSLVHADPTQIHQVILNLCTNSYHAMEESTGTLSISLKDINLATPKIIGKHALDAGNYVVITITDTGHGIAPEIIKLIFDPYFTTKEQGKGTGLGLAMVQGIIDSHGGGIEVESHQGHGTTFRIYLPTLQAQHRPSNQDPMEDEELLGGDETILMVDDELPIINSLSTILQKFGYTVDTFTDPALALLTFMEDPNKYDLILTDMTMPEITGADLAQQILQKKPGIPIIIATGNTDIISAENAQKLGIKAYCAKPIPLPILLKTIRQALDQ